MKNTLIIDGVSYTDDRIKFAQAAIDTSLNERVLDVDTMTITLDTAGLTPDFENFAQDVPVYFLRSGSQYALWYIKEAAQVAPHQWTLSLMSSLGRLTQMPHRGGYYYATPAIDIIDDICGVVPHYVSPVFANVLLYGILPYVSPSGENGAQTGSAKDNLLQVLFALNATVRDDANGTLRIENLSTAVSSVIDDDRVYVDNALVRREAPITSVTVLEHQYISGGDQTTLFEGTTTAGQVIVFREPMSNLSATGFSITESDANYAVLSAGTGTLTGQAYIHTTREITRTVTAAAIPNPARIEDATLVGLTNSAEVADRLADYYAHRTYIECDATIDFEDAGDVVSLYDPFAKVQRLACIEKISPLTVSQTMKGRISALVGFLPWQVVPFEDVRILLTGSGTWTVPEGVTQVTVVLIGGGDGGDGGINGANGTRQIVDKIVYRYNHAMGGGAGQGGQGGAGGQGGSGGMILRAELAVSPGQAFSYSCGAPGSAGGTNGGIGGLGAATTFGTQSSSSGSASASGYADPVTGDIYAASGNVGVSGGDGGDGGSASSSAASDGGNGDDVDTYTGGVGTASSYSKGFDPTTIDSRGGAGGGGAAIGANGNSGEGVTNGSPTGVLNASGGAGANATAPSAPSVYGCGGNGGNGGGGGGGTPAFFFQNRRKASEETLHVQYYPTIGAGGVGSAGSAGAAGCIIVYYRQPVVSN